MEANDPGLSLRRRRKGHGHRSAASSSISPVPLLRSRGGDEGGSQDDDEGDYVTATGQPGRPRASGPPACLPPASSAPPPQLPPPPATARGHCAVGASGSLLGLGYSVAAAAPPPPRAAPAPAPALAAPKPAPKPAPPEAAAAVRSSVAKWSGKGAEDDAQNCWSEAPSEVFQVRGPKYLSDKKKVASAPCLYETVGLDVLFNNENAAPARVS
jgi:hypothetical protein